MGLEHDLAGLLRTVARPLTLRELRKQKVDTVRVIGRSQFNEILKRAEADGKTRLQDADKRRMERLIQENERLGRDKKELEHAKGLVALFNCGSSRSSSPSRPWPPSFKRSCSTER